MVYLNAFDSSTYVRNKKNEKKFFIIQIQSFDDVAPTIVVHREVSVNTKVERRIFVLQIDVMELERRLSFPVEQVKHN